MKNALIFSTLLILGTLSATGQSSTFTVAQLGHPVGTARSSISPAPNGLLSTSQVQISMEGLNYALSNSVHLSPAFRLRHAQLSATVNGSAVSVTAAVDAAQYLLNISANGRSATTRLQLYPNAVLLPDFDPAALQTMLDLATSPANAHTSLWAIVPKQSNAQDGSIQPASIQPIQLATYRDEQGSFDGKSIVVHHLVATIAGARTELFSSPSNQLLQAELPQQGFALVREGFVLTPPTHPIPPPSE
jgi:hypothetical protein